MVLRKILVDNSVRYIPISEKNKRKYKKQGEQIQPISGGKLITRKQNKNISQNSKKFLKNVAASGFGCITN